MEELQFLLRQPADLFQLLGFFHCRDTSLIVEGYLEDQAAPAVWAGLRQESIADRRTERRGRPALPVAGPVDRDGELLRVAPEELICIRTAQSIGQGSIDVLRRIVQDAGDAGGPLEGPVFFRAGAQREQMQQDRGSQQVSQFEKE